MTARPEIAGVAVSGVDPGGKSSAAVPQCTARLPVALRGDGPRLEGQAVTSGATCWVIVPVPLHPSSPRLNRLAWMVRAPDAAMVAPCACGRAGSVSPLSRTRRDPHFSARRHASVYISSGRIPGKPSQTPMYDRSRIALKMGGPIRLSTSSVISVSKLVPVLRTPRLQEHPRWQSFPGASLGHL